MKYKIGFSVCLVYIFIFFAVSNASGQFGIRKIVKAGYAWSKFNGDYPYDQQSKKALCGGIGLELNLLGIVSLEGDASFSAKGTNALIHGKETTIQLNYISFPIVVKYKIFPVLIHPYILGGIEFSTLLSGKQDGNSIKDQIKPQDHSILAGGGFELTLFGRGILLEGIMGFGQNEVLKDHELTKVRNRFSQINLGVLF